MSEIKKGQHAVEKTERLKFTKSNVKVRINAERLKMI